ncbi:MAG: efflux RND transporter permease subunit, partial [Muribaculaceae bacterium]|nr:efflux RND transporter permease subunit [Muribaculaceae bacterium]
AWPKTTLALGVLCIVGGSLLFVSRPLQLMPIAERNQFAVEIFLPQGTSVERTTMVADSLERILSKDPRVVSIASFLGCSSPRFQATYAPQVGGPDFAQFIVNTKSNAATIDVLNEYTEKYESYFPDAFVRFKQLSYSTASYPIQIKIKGSDEATLHAVADSVAAIARRVPGLRNVRTSLGNPLASALVVPDNTKAERLGLNSTLMESTLALRYSSGLPVATVWEGDYGIPVKLKTGTSNRSDVSELEREPMPVIGLSTVPLNQVSNVVPEWHPGMITHYNGIPTVSVMAEVQRNINVIDRTEVLMDSLKRLDLPAGITIERGGEWENTMDTLPEILSGLAMAVAIIFFILLFHYAQADTSALLLFSLLLCVPGAAIGLLIQDTALSLTCVLGIVSLMGILVRNAIVLLDYAEELRNQGQTVHDAVLNASKRRMRPIFLTSAAATMGVLPMVTGSSALWKPMGVVIFWGTPITMIFILTVIPVAYSMMKSRSKGANQPLPEPLETHLL